MRWRKSHFCARFAHQIPAQSVLCATTTVAIDQSRAIPAGAAKDKKHAIAELIGLCSRIVLGLYDEEHQHDDKHRDNLAGSV